MSAAEMTIDPISPLWLIVLLFIFASAAALAQYAANRHKLGAARAACISGLRFLALFLVVAVALNPSLTLKNERKSPLSIAVIVDRSMAMGYPEGGRNVSPLDQAAALLQKGRSPLLKSLRKNFEVGLYGLADSLTPLGADDIEELRGEGKAGDMAEALKTLKGRRSVALFLSSGNLKPLGEKIAQVPTISVGLGNPSAYRDVLIKEIKTPSIGFRGREIVLDVKVGMHGYGGLTLPVILSDGEKQLAIINIPIRAGESEKSLALSFIPDKAGRRNLSISIPRQRGETIGVNNRINFTLNVLRDKTRILMVSGSPSMNYRILRSALKGDPSIDLLSFVVMRTPADILNVAAREQSLVPFPAETIFTKDLKDFDLIIFDNFDYSVYLRPPYLENIRRFVREGGGFAMIGGPGLFNEGMNGLTPMADLLPFRFTEKDLYRRNAPAGVRLTATGARHPIMKFSGDLSGDEGARRRFWQDLAPLDGINVTDAKNLSKVLMESAGGIPWPVLTVAEFGKGRTMALTTDYAWKWQMATVASGKGNRPYLMLVHRMVRWLTRDPSLEPYRIILPPEPPLVGKETEIGLQSEVNDPYRVSAGAVSFSVFNPDGSRIAIKIKPLSRDGRQSLSFIPEKAGLYRIKAETAFVSLEETLVAIGPFDRLDAAPDHERLKKISAATGGKFLLPGDDILKTITDYANKAEKQFIVESNAPLWATPGLMLAVIALLSLEWYLRRRWGLV